MGKSEAIRVLQSVSAMDHGGIEHFIMNLYRKIDRDKVQFDFIYRVACPCAFDDEIRSLGGRIYRCPSPDRHPFRSMRFYGEFFKQHPEYRVVHEHRSNLRGFMGLIRAAERHGRINTRIVHSHSSMSVNKQGLVEDAVCRVTSLLNRAQIDNLATDYFACSDKAASWMFPVDNADCGSVRIIPNGIDTDAFAFSELDRKRIRQQYDIPQDAFVVGSVARFSAVKNHSFLIDVFRRLAASDSNSYLLLLGDGELMPSIRQKVKDMGLMSRVVFAGVQEDTPPFYSAMDVVCMPSHFEGLPVSSVEAQANGLPIVFSSDVSKDAGLTSTVKYLDLELGADLWAQEVASCQCDLRARMDGQLAVKSAGFDVAGTAAWLQEFYLCRHNGR